MADSSPSVDEDHDRAAIAVTSWPQSATRLGHVRSHLPCPRAARPAADPPVLAGARAGRPPRRQRAHPAPRHRPAARARLPGRRHAPGRPAATGWPPAPTCPRCCSTTTRRSPSPSACGPRPAPSVEGIEETSVRALAKLDHVLPDRLRRRVGAVHATVVPLRVASGPRPDGRPGDARRAVAGAASTARRSGSSTSAATARRGGAWSSPTSSCRPGAAGTSWRGTCAATTGARSGSTG